MTAVPVARAAERFQVAWPTAKRWAERYRELGRRQAMQDRSSERPHRQSTRTPQPIVRKIVHVRWKRRARAGRDRLQRRRAQPRLFTRSCCAAGSAVCPRSTGLPANPCAATSIPYPGVVAPPGRQEAREHPRRRRLALRRPGARPAQPHQPPRPSGASRHGVKNDGSTAMSTPSSMTTAASPTPRSTTTRPAVTAIGVLRRAVIWFAARGVIVERVLTDNGPCYRSLLWRQQCTAPRHQATSGPGPTGPRPTARSSASTAP